MKKYICILAVALLTLTACSSDNGESKDDLTVQKLIGLWVSDYKDSGSDDDVSWNRIVKDYVFRADGTGYWECYLLDGNQLVDAEADRDNDATHYTISGNTVTVTRDNSIIKWTLTYADGKLTDPEEGTVYQKATTAQQTLVEWLYSEWQGMNSGEEGDDGNLNTPVTDEYTDEPARVPRH